MNITLSFIRLFFILISIAILSAYATTTLQGGFSLVNLLIGIALGGIAGSCIISTDRIFRRFNLRAFNVAVLGLFCGYLMGEVLIAILSSILDLSDLPMQTASLIKTFIFLFSCYFGMVMAARASEEIYVSIPFVKFKPSSHKKKDVLLDSSILLDSRVIDLASSGLLDQDLIIPRFNLKEFYGNLESTDEALKTKARRSLDVVKRLESIPSLDLRYADTDFPEIKDPTSKLIRLARLLDANILTGDMNRIQQSSIESIEGIRIINIHMLSNALKPISHAGECISIKIQRYGKEPRQGIGYLEDGTMVVVNGGAEFIGEAIKAQVLSVKHTSSGRMIFCNAMGEGDDEHDGQKAYSPSVDELENVHKTYFPA